MQPYIFYHPLKVIFLDDNRSFLDALELEFDTSLNMSTFTNSNNAIQSIRNNHERLIASIFKKKSVNDSDTINNTFDLQLNHITDVLYNQARFDQVAILVIDYNMPGMTGIEICRQLKRKNLYKIMLTAEADKDTAIEAFNEGIIDKFILKTQNYLYEAIISIVQKLTQQYFEQLSSNIICTYLQSINTLFNNSSYLELFNQLILETQAVEYYLTDYSGSFLFLDINAKPTWLIIRSDNELNEQNELLEGYEISSDLKGLLANRERMLFIPSEESYKKPVNQWFQYLYPTNRLDNNNYYTIIDGQLRDTIQWNRIISYASYLKNHDNKLGF